MVDEAVIEYEVELSNLIEQANKGRLSKAEFKKQLRLLMEGTLFLMYLLAGGDILDSAGRQELDRRVNLHHASMNKLARDVYAGKYQAKGGRSHEKALASVAAKVALWGATALGVYNVGRAYHREKTRKFTWVYGDTKHCKHCSAQSGKTRTAKEWRDLQAKGIYPQSPGLECGGWNCRCQLVEADPLEDAIKL